MNSNDFRNSLRVSMGLKSKILNESVISPVAVAQHLDRKEMYRKSLQDNLANGFQPAIPPVINATQTAEPIEEPIEERANPISVVTLAGTIKKLGPKGLGETIAGLPLEMNKIDNRGAPASEFSLFVDSIKQAGLKIITTGNVTPSATGPGETASASQAPQSVAGSTVAPMGDNNQDKLANLVTPTAPSA